MVKGLRLATFISLAFVFFTGCGSDSGSCGTTSDTSSSNPLSEAMPTLAITSPTATSSCATAVVASRQPIWKSVMQAALAFPGLNSLIKFLNRPAFSADEVELKPINEMVNERKAELDAPPGETAAGFKIDKEIKDV